MSASEASAATTDLAAQRMCHWPVVVAAAIGLILSQGTLLVYSFGLFLPSLATEFG